MITRWPDSRTAFWKPDLKNGARRRETYEDQGARISILAGRQPPRPDTLKQTDHAAISIKPLADGAGHTFFKILDRAGGLGMMAGAGRELAITHLAQRAAESLLGDGDTKFLEDPLAEVNNPPAQDRKSTRLNSSHRL